MNEYMVWLCSNSVLMEWDISTLTMSCSLSAIGDLLGVDTPVTVPRTLTQVSDHMKLPYSDRINFRTLFYIIAQVKSGGDQWIKVGDRVVCTVDFDQATIEFACNGKPQGVSVTFAQAKLDPNGTVYPAASMVYQGQELKLEAP